MTQMDGRRAKDLTDAERAEWLKAHSRRVRDAALAELRGAKPELPPTEKLAKDMSDAERDAFLKEHARKFR